MMEEPLCCSRIFPSGTCIRTQIGVAFAGLQCLPKACLVFHSSDSMLVKMNEALSHPQMKICGKIHGFQYKIHGFQASLLQWCMLQHGIFLCVGVLGHTCTQVALLPSTVYRHHVCCIPSYHVLCIHYISL